MKRAQSSQELILMMGFIGLLMLASISMLYEYGKSTVDSIISESVSRIGNNIVKNAELVYIFGYPSRIVLPVTFPKKVVNMTIESGHYLVIETQQFTGTAYSVFYSRYNMTGHFTLEDFTEGEKEFLFTTTPDGEVVNITRWISD